MPPKKNTEKSKKSKISEPIEQKTEVINGCSSGGVSNNNTTTAITTSNSNSGKIKIINNYIQNVLNALPQASISTSYCHDSLFYKSICDENNNRAEPIIISNHFFDDFPVHDNVLIKCCFCDTLLNPSLKDFNIFEQPQSRRRFTPYCLNCANKNSENINFI